MSRMASGKWLAVNRWLPVKFGIIPWNHAVNGINFALKMKKSNISDCVVEFVLNCSNEDFQSLTVSKMATLFNVNRCYLSRRFKKDKEFTVCEFLVREKLFRSVGILKEDTQLTIKEISEKLGFANSNYFCRIFKRHFGTTPGRYREYVGHKRPRAIT